jgi:hypothetical protein
MTAAIVINITCSGCEQQVSAVVQPRKANRVSHLLEEALAAAHLAACYIEEDPRGQDQEDTDPGSSGAEGSAEGESSGSPSAPTVH